jgi:hypothetical protein
MKKKIVFENGNSIEWMEFPDGSRHGILRGSNPPGYPKWVDYEESAEEVQSSVEISTPPGAINGNPPRTDPETDI